ncbi:unnamed protein product [Schistocephalus solidus]|uniref:C2H2-type domain-containing protein n=1 Tax=Schistocephalus solidus TaxID=70667 RepID=A0A183T4J0_SCHSO|nr:unnamed protein product [Schistocephalus solidus]
MPLINLIAFSSPVTAPAQTTITTNHNAPPNIYPSTANSSDVESVTNCLYYNCTFTSRIGLVDHLPIHRMEPDEPVSGAEAYSRRTASAAHTALVHSHTSWTSWESCVSTRTCGKQL